MKHTIRAKILHKKLPHQTDFPPSTLLWDGSQSGEVAGEGAHG